MDSHQLDELCRQWATWCFTRRFYVRGGSQGLLARLHPSRCGKEPDGKNIAFMQHFNKALHALCAEPQYADEMVCFRLMYVEEADHIKRQADKLGISRPTYYNRSRAFARRAWELAQLIAKAQEIECS
jgi:hypothetical protein